MLAAVFHVMHILSNDLGRLEYNELSQQALMEMFVEGLNSKAIFQDANGFYTDITAWIGVECNEDGEVTAICWHTAPAEGALSGTLFYEFLPKTVREIQISEKPITGSIDFAQMPLQLTELYIWETQSVGRALESTSYPPNLAIVDISTNKLTGSIITSAFPPTLVEMLAYENDFEGTLALQDLPRQMSVLSAAKNKLWGTIDFAGLPESLKELDLYENSFTDIVSMQDLPSGLEELQLYDNRLNLMPELCVWPNALKKMDFRTTRAHGTLALEELPPCVEHFGASWNMLQGSLNLQGLITKQFLEFLFLHRNFFSGEVCLTGLPPRLQKLWLHKNSLVGTLDLTGLPGAMIHLYLYENNFHGTIDLSSLPGEMRELKLQCNQLSGRIDITNVPETIKIMDLTENLFERGIVNAEMQSEDIELRKALSGLKRLAPKHSHVMLIFSY